MHPGIKKSINACLDFIYPQACLHCGEAIGGKERLCCNSCYALLELLSPDRRCSRCFSLKKEHDCFPSTFAHVAAAFEYFGPICSLVQGMKYGNMPYLSQSLASFMFLQWQRLGWDVPDMLVPIPMCAVKKQMRGYSQSLLLAEHLSKLMQVPVVEAIEKQSWTYSQSTLSKEERGLMPKGIFTVKEGIELTGKRVLLVDDILTTGTTLRRAAEALWDEYPLVIEAITCCRA